MNTTIRKARRLARPLKRYTRSASLFMVRQLASRASTRGRLNKIFDALSPAQKERMHDRFNGIFYGPHLPVVEPGPWYHTFEGHAIKTAITAKHAGFDWDMALSILGHDVLVKESYRNLLRFSKRPDLFIDIGANYGTDSILFLVCGVRTISFEPNALCHRSFRELCLMTIAAFVSGRR